MGSRIAFAGLVVLIAGMVLALSVAHIVNSHEYEINAAFSQYSPGEFVSGDINMDNSSGILYISNNSTSVYLVPAGSLGAVNGSNAAQYAVAPSATGNVTSGGFAYSLGDTGRLYSNLSGSYNIVAFGDSSPSIAYDTTTNVDTTVLSLYGPLTIAGEVMWIGGTFVTAIGFVYPWKKKV